LLQQNLLLLIAEHDLTSYVIDDDVQVQDQEAQDDPIDYAILSLKGMCQSIPLDKRTKKQ
jgi:hypothetical protein